MTRKVNDAQLYLLLWAEERPGGGMASTTAVPACVSVSLPDRSARIVVDVIPQRIGMAAMNGLVKRGLFSRSKNTLGVFLLTEEGRLAIQENMDAAIRLADESDKWSKENAS